MNFLIQLLSVCLLVSLASSEQKISELSFIKEKVPQLYCPKLDIYCDYEYRYRTLNGQCNNLFTKWWGQANAPYNRILLPAYDDSLSKPRTKSAKYDYYLPNALEIAYTIHYPEPSYPQTTELLTFFTQHVMFDLLSTQQQYPAPNCTCDYPDPYNCFNINAYTYYGDYIPCIELPRSGADLKGDLYECKIAFREQVNMVTSWLDQSSIYGIDEYILKSLLVGDYGLFLTSINPYGKRDLPLKKYCTFGISATDSHDCYATADERNQDNLYLTMFTRIFVLEHNRIALEIYNKYPSLDPYTIFEEARKIMIAEYQHIVYGELLPILLGSEAMKRYELIPQPDYEYFLGYDKSCNPAIKNAFGIAGRLHTLINANHLSYNKYCDLTSNVTTNYIVETYTYYYDELTRGALLQNSWFYTPAINYDLLPLAAINIQRGRDHGLPGYNKYRAWCGLNYAYSFDDLTNIPEYTRTKLAALYDHVDDIDLWTGLTSEYPVKDGVVGETAACILGLGFKDLKFGDRFYYENDNPVTGFNIDSLYQIKQASMARLICDNTDIYFIQAYPFLLADEYTNPLYDCDDIRSVEFTKWHIEY